MATTEYDEDGAEHRLRERAKACPALRDFLEANAVRDITRYVVDLPAPEGAAS